MDVDYFLTLRPDWAQQPCLYVILQEGGLKNADGNYRPNINYRVGASGTSMFKGSDRPYRSEDAQNFGLLSRCRMYRGFHNPFSTTIFAALRVKQALVAEMDKDRLGTDSSGNVYNVNRGSRTLVLTRERELHNILDEKGLRYQKDTRNELFQTRNVEELISAMRYIRGEELYLFSKDAITEDPKYKGGSRRERITVTETQPRQQPQRESRAPSLTITLSRSALEQLRSGSPQQFERLINLVREFDEERQRTTTVRAPKEVVQEMRQQTDAGRQILDAVVAQRPTRRSPRIAELNDRSTEATIEAPRRSARLARN
jgi:hypothetical protein